MSTTWQERQQWSVGMTAPILEIQFTEDNSVIDENLTGYAAWGSFWYSTESVPHKIGQAYLPEPGIGLVRYELDGTEVSAVGEISFQVTTMNPGSQDSSVEEWGTYSSEIIRARVVI